MSTGDLKNNLRKLQLETKSVKYTEELDIDGLASYDFICLLELYTMPMEPICSNCTLTNNQS